MRHVSTLSAFFFCLLLSITSVADTTTWPMIVAHRGGTGDAPENTLLAIKTAIQSHADAIWLTVQLSKDGIPVLYRPADLSTLTNTNGKIANYTAQQLSTINAGWQYKTQAGDYPYRQQPTTIPTLKEALDIIPPHMPVFLDMKALPAEQQTLAVAALLTQEQAWNRVTIYSTEAAYQQTFQAYPHARLFESRDLTRGRLVKTLLGDECTPPSLSTQWVAFEWKRRVKVSEQFTLGEGISEATAHLWTPATISCFRKSQPVNIMAIGIDNPQDYQQATCLKINAILADSPRKMSQIKEQLQKQNIHCDNSVQ